MSGYSSYMVEEVRERKTGGEKQPFPHQLEAFGALASTLTTPITGYKGTMLVLPTGAGKTFTAVNWICRNILSKGIKVLWLAQSSTLLDQAAQTFKSEMHHISERDSINMRVVSSSDHHANAGTIVPTDDVVICTTQTAIRAYFTEATDLKGGQRNTPFREYVDHFSDEEFFVVVDEAHHTPAFGCRTLLTSMRTNMKNLYILGLTATPMHNDKRISGWLWEIYNEKICYEADKNVLQTNGILSVPKYIEKQTGIDFEVDDKLYERLTSKHKDLPEEIIEKIAKDSSRNNFIVSDYVNNKEEYGKTLIFADRWFQCEYIVGKLNDLGVKANAVYSKVENSNEPNVEGVGRRSNKDNMLIMKDFREGKYDVLVNVRMLTEGVDVPDVKTVMMTRQTTSPILFTQMAGRALRGEKAGGGEEKDHANIVMFMDNWKRLLNFVDDVEGVDSDKPSRQGRNPFDLISIQLVKNVVADIMYEGYEQAPYLRFIPVGWYAAEYVVSIEDHGTEELVSCMESSVVYDFNEYKYDKLMDFLLQEDLGAWADESLEDDELLPIASSYAHQFFIDEEDNLDGNLHVNIVGIIRHIAQNKTKPEFFNFNERNVYDLDRIALEHEYTPPRECITYLKNVYNDEGLLWKLLYKNFMYFKKAFDHSMNRILMGPETGQPIDGIGINEPVGVLTDEMRQQVYLRDNLQCLCCGKKRRKGVSLEIDHILPIAMGGKNTPSNLQTLCRQCNSIKGVNEIDYRSIISPLNVPKEMLLFNITGSDAIENVIARIVNHIYHCKALCNLEYNERRNGKNYSTWIINLYNGNNPQWLEDNLPTLLNYVQRELGWTNLEQIIVKT
ncbi:DEAD/DEAH box helicase family protein [Sporosarcina sp. E16_3]|uniref:DEAD/DEAH box helicase family protein n=1 Tax=Sporosarcina sp. E16_3 TaxID=2789293 RepID=UPI001A913824|nr:DEAD/DEAH box helicase family protein [Sporosarcina sp. E16_3]MBO0603465.1 DEAD/DEAH box helicase family protein [Sporosarcina sp. E16_3]